MKAVKMLSEKSKQLLIAISLVLKSFKIIIFKDGSVLKVPTCNSYLCKWQSSVCKWDWKYIIFNYYWDVGT